MSGLANRDDVDARQTAAAKDRLFCAVDNASLAGALRAAALVTGVVGGLKLGKEFYTANGPQGCVASRELDLPLFLDLKFHDIPNTVSGAVRAVLPLKPVILTVHASGGSDMLKAAVDAANRAMIRRLLPR